VIYRLAVGGSQKIAIEAFEGSKPALLTSYIFLGLFDRLRPEIEFRDWAMDSGAFSAKNSGKEIELQAFIDECAKRLEEDEQLTEVFALDVIGDADASMRNTEEMWRQGVPAVPAFHMGSPWSYLEELVKTYPKIGLGGMVGRHTGHKTKWVRECFARAWPYRFHGFGIGTKPLVMKYPWDSIDATNWSVRPSRYGLWDSLGVQLPRGSGRASLRREVEYCLRMEHEHEQLWDHVKEEAGL
jgi:hypothetical protein